MTTIKQLEQTLNVSRVSLYAILKKDWLSGHVLEGEKGNILVDDAGVDILRKYYSSKNRGGAPRKNVMAELNEARNSVDAAETDADVIGILQEQLAKKDEQINALLGIVSSQQKLHA